MQVRPMSSETSPDTPIEKTGTPTEQSQTKAPRLVFVPAVDVYESEEKLLLLVDLPGVERKAIDLEVEAGTLLITATQPERGRLLRRAFTLPETVDPAGVDAQLSQGVLTVQLRKRADMKPRRIEIRSGG